MLTQTSKNKNRRHVHERIRKKILGIGRASAAECVSLAESYLRSVIDDLQGATLVSANSAEGKKASGRTGGQPGRGQGRWQKYR